MKHGDFTELADDYASYRPGYSTIVLRGILGITGLPASELDAVDVGAGTGIWTRMLAESGARSIIAVEPNGAMRERGEAHPENRGIVWKAGSGETSGLDAMSADLVTMASSFHWVDFERGIAEFDRILRPGGCFAALWNPRVIESSPLLMEIEAYASALNGAEVRRVSSGKSGFTDALATRLRACGVFAEVAYLESQHVIEFTSERYMGAWRSVNDLRVQLGPQKFAQFLEQVANRISGMPTIPATYLTRAWVARKPS